MAAILSRPRCVDSWNVGPTYITWANMNADPDLYSHMVPWGHNELTHSGWDNMAAFLQTTA